MIIKKYIPQGSEIKTVFKREKIHFRHHVHLELFKFKSSENFKDFHTFMKQKNLVQASAAECCDILLGWEARVFSSVLVGPSASSCVMDQVWGANRVVLTQSLAGYHSHAAIFRKHTLIVLSFRACCAFCCFWRVH